MTSRGTKYWSSGAIPLIAPDMLGDIIATASDLAIVISDVGKILSVLTNPHHTSFGRLDHWEGRDLREMLTVESVPKFEARLEAFSAEEDNSRPIELNHADGITWEFPVRYTFHRVGPDGALLMLGRDLRPIAEMQQQLVKAQMTLERDYEAKREFDTRYRVLMETTRDAMVFVNMASGRIADLNDGAAVHLGATRDDLLGAAFAQEFEGRRRGEFLENLTSAAIADADQPIDLTARRSKKKLLVTPRVFRAAGERLLLCRIGQSEAENLLSDQQGENLAGLYRDGSDGMVFTDRNGIILSANDAFLNLADVAHLSSAKGKSLADYLERGAVDLKVLIDNAMRSGTMRLYATKLAGEFGAQISVEISATYLNDRANPCVAFVMRDASRVDALRRPGMAASPDGMKSVMELVGSATLREIVSETTEVVERMCIETAVELTRNNRVAAAEMLGLSRQSLYVKLRKYGLLNRDGT